MTNHAELAADWHDQVNARDGSDVLVAEVSAGLSTGLPSIEKAVWDPELNGGLGDWTDSIDAQVGDVIEYRARFNCDDTQRPIRDDISLGYITLTDWLPPGTVYNGDAVPSYVATFTQPASAPATPTPDPDVPSPVTLGGLSGIEWFLGDVSADGWWETTFTVTVVDAPVVQEGLKTGNHWKLTGINTFGQEYSDRDIADLDYVDPHPDAQQRATAVPNPLIPGSVVPYTITIDNVRGRVPPRTYYVTDTLPEGMRETTPTITVIELDGSPLADGVDYTTSYNSGTGEWLIDLHDGAIDTPVPGGSQLFIRLRFRRRLGRGSRRHAQRHGERRLQHAARRQRPRLSRRTTTLSTPTPTTPRSSSRHCKSPRPATPAAITIGETVHYDVTVTVPRGMIAYWPSIRIASRVTAPGIVDRARATITDTTGTPVVGAAFESTGTPTRAIRVPPTARRIQLGPGQPDRQPWSSGDYTFVLGYDLHVHRRARQRRPGAVPPGHRQRPAHERLGRIVYWD